MRARRLVTTAALLALITAACGNSSSGTKGATAHTVPKTPMTTASAADLGKNVPRPGVKGVTDSTIRAAVITATTNPIGGKYHQMIDGIKAYFKVINDAGGIYGRKLEVVSDRDDVVGTKNQAETQASLANDNAFVTFEATQQLTGADDLAKAGMPTFVWNIDPEFASSPTSDHSNIFGNVPAICFTCISPLVPWIAVQNNYTKVGILGYGVSQESKDCATGTRDAYKKWTNGKVQVAFYDDTIPFAGDLKADVSRMKDAGVQFVSTCMDTNQVLKLQKEMKTQNFNAVQSLPNAYDHDWVQQNGSVLEGDYLQTMYPPSESQPQSPATQKFLTSIKAITNDPVELTEIGWIDAMMFVDGLKGAGPEFTQQKVIDYLNAQTAYSADGLIQPIDWTTGHIDPSTHPEVRLKEWCQPILVIQGGKFVPYKTPDGKPWSCFDQTATSKGADQTPAYRSFAPGGVG